MFNEIKHNVDSVEVNKDIYAQTTLFTSSEL